MEICKINCKIVGWKIDKTNKKEPGIRPESITSTMSPKRPIELPCEINKVKINGEQWTIFVGILNDRPYEIFGGLSKYIDIPNKYDTGKIIKKEKKLDNSIYSLEIGEKDSEIIIKDIANVFENSIYGAFSRTISLSLRHGVPIQYIVEQLQKDKHSDVTSFSKVMARVLKKYIADGTIPVGEKVCPDCKKTDGLVYQSGCVGCSCGWSRC